MHRGKGKGKRRELIAAALSAVALAAASPQVALAASDLFIKIGDIKGESQDDQHKDWVEVLAYSWGLSGATRNAPKPQQPVGPLQAACAQEFTITKTLDKASPALFASTATGTTIPSVTFNARRPDGSGGGNYLVMTFSNVVITAVEDGGSGGEDRPTESVSFNFGSVQITYTPQAPAGVAANSVSATVPGTCR
jgi:type VI secretion system secreted protein Hcp